MRPNFESSLFMRHSVSVLFVTSILTVCFYAESCSGRKVPEGETPKNDSTFIDSLSHQSEMVSEEEELISESPMPVAAEEYFDDFFFNFAANRKLQLERIKFPLMSTNGDETTRIEKKQWQMDYFFMRQGYYTQIFDNQQQMDLAKDSTVDHVMLERINFSSQRVQRYDFHRKNGRWQLTQVFNESIEHNANASFLRFYSQFVADSAFQQQSLNDVVTFSSPSPDNDFETQTGEIVPEQWPMFKPELIPHGTIYNIMYSRPVEGSNQKIFVTRGVANGMEAQMIFRKRAGHWRLVHFDSL